MTASTSTYYQGVDFFMQPSVRTLGFSVKLNSKAQPTMKRNNIKQGFLSLAAACLAFTACTGDFERFNTDLNAAQDVDLKMFITTMQMDAVYSCSGSDTDPNNRYQKL